MTDEPKKIIVDDDWKAQAQREKEQLAEETAAAGQMPQEPNFLEVLNLIVMQAMAGLGLMGTPDGQRIPPNFEVAKHFIDLLAILEVKTKGNLEPDEEKILQQTLYELRMHFVQITTGAAPGAGDAAPGSDEAGPASGPKIVTE